MGSEFNGLNGTTVLKAVDLPVARIPGASYGYKRSLLVTVELRVERLQRRAVYETVNHEKVTEPYEFACTTSVWRPDGKDIVAGGATTEPLLEAAEHATSWCPGFNAATALELAALGNIWHLNAMQAACAHQEVVWEDSKYGRRPSLDDTPRCPQTGYKYGSAWLVKPLPADFMDTLNRLLAGVDHSRIHREGK